MAASHSRVGQDDKAQDAKCETAFVTGQKQLCIGFTTYLSVSGTAELCPCRRLHTGWLNKGTQAQGLFWKST